MSAQPVPFYTLEQYLELERKADFKSEYVSGQIFAMAGGSPNHSAIIGNVTGAAWFHLRGKPCRIFNSDLRVTVMQTGLSTYPDVTVVCGETHYHPLDEDSVINPTVIFEVLSPTTEAYDRGGKWAHYRRLESLQEYVLVSQDKALAEHYVREADGAWKFTEASGLEGVLNLPSLGCALPLTEIYDKVTFDALPTLSPISPNGV